jgi:hypothetical protein
LTTKQSKARLISWPLQQLPLTASNGVAAIYLLNKTKHSGIHKDFVDCFFIDQQQKYLSWISKTLLEKNNKKTKSS